MYQYRVSDKTISKFVPEVADAIFKVLKDDYFKFPQSKEEWLEISRGIYDKWQFPNYIGAMDGKHIPIKCPKGDGSTFFNYKGFHSIVLFGLVDSEHKFIFTDVGFQRVLRWTRPIRVAVENDKLNNFLIEFVLITYNFHRIMWQTENYCFVKNK